MGLFVFDPMMLNFSLAVQRGAHARRFAALQYVGISMPITARQLNRACHMAAEVVGLGTWVSPHTLRHSGLRVWTRSRHSPTN
jgi:integrase